MAGFRELRSKSVVLAQTNIDTDQIIPARFLSTTERAGLGKNAFNDWRWQADGSPNPAFPFNQPGNAGRQILLAGRNFGCGSSREQAPIALKQVGVAMVIAKGFARIFRRNSINIGLPVWVADVADDLKTGDTVEVDLEKGIVTVNGEEKQFTTKEFDLLTFL